MIIRDTVHIRQEIGEITSSRPWKYNGHSQGPESGCVPLQSTVYYLGIAMQWLSHTCGAVSGTVYQCEALICPCFVVMKRISKCHDATTTMSCREYFSEYCLQSKAMLDGCYGTM